MVGLPSYTIHGTIKVNHQVLDTVPSKSHKDRSWPRQTTPIVRKVYVQI
jgi:hypothetical protein